MPFLIFFAAISSMLATGIILLDFFSDAFKIPLEARKGFKRVVICLLVFIPPMILGLFTHIDLLAIVHSTLGFASLIMTPIIPIFWVWSARYEKKIVEKPILFGGKQMLIIISFLTAFIFYTEGVLLIQRIIW